MNVPPYHSLEHGIISLLFFAGTSDLWEGSVEGKWERKRGTIEHYDRLASIYDSLYGEEQSIKMGLALRNVKVRSGDLLLDIGCGTGILMEFVASMIRHYVGLDLARETLKVASERSKRLRVKSKVSLIRADADYLPFRAGSFSIIFALTLLQNIPKPSRTLMEILRVAKGKSQIVITGLKKSFTKKEFDELICNIWRDHTFLEAPGSKDFIVVIKVKDK